MPGSRRRSVVDFRQAMSNEIESTIAELEQIWNECGLSEDACEQRLETALREFANMAHDMLTEENAMRNRLKSKIAEHQQKIADWSEQLSIEVPNEVDYSQSLLAQEHKLRVTYMQLQPLKEQRQRMRDTLAIKDIALCRIIGDEPFAIRGGVNNPGAIPTEAENEALRLHVDQKMKLYQHRLDKFNSLKKKVEQAFAFLRISTPRTEIEERVLRGCVELECNDEQQYPLTQQAIDQLKQHTEALDIECQQFVAYVNEQVEKLWSRLEELWIKCGVSDNQRTHIEKADALTFQPEILDIYQSEIARLEALYIKRKAVYDAYHSWLKLWSEKEELETRANSVDRYKNRGGNLAKELAREKALNIRYLPAAREQLALEVLRFENENPGDIFKINGQPPLDAVDNIIQTHDMNKQITKSMSHSHQLINVKNLRRDPFIETQASPKVKVINSPIPDQRPSVATSRMSPTLAGNRKPCGIARFNPNLLNRHVSKGTLPPMQPSAPSSEQQPSLQSSSRSTIQSSAGIISRSLSVFNLLNSNEHQSTSVTVKKEPKDFDSEDGLSNLDKENVVNK